MVVNMKKNHQSGNTLTIVLICLVVITILSLSTVYAVSYTTTYRLKKSQENFNKIMLENKSYETLNAFVQNYNQNQSLEDELWRFKEEYYFNDSYTIQILDITLDTMTFQIRYLENQNCILVESKFILNDKNEIQEYKIMKWGMTTWI